MNWKIDKNRAICPQLCEQLCAHIAAGAFLPGQRLMSVRDVAVAAGVNPNTVQRAFEQLEQQGILRSERGSGWYVTANTDAAHQVREKIIHQKIDAFFREMNSLGMSDAQIKQVVKEWNP